MEWARPFRVPAAIRGPEQEEQALNMRGEVDGAAAEGEPAPSTRHRLRARRSCWDGETLHRMGLVCALTLSVIAGGIRMDRGPAKGPAPPTRLRNHPSALAEAALVLAAVAAGVAARTMRVCTRDELICAPPPSESRSTARGSAALYGMGCTSMPASASSHFAWRHCNGSDTRVGAVTFVDAASVAASAFVAALVALAPAGLSRRAVVRRARRGVEFLAALPQHLLEASSTLRELISASAHLLRGGRRKVVMERLGCVFIMGGVVTPSSLPLPRGDVSGTWVGRVRLGRLAQPNPELQRPAPHLLDLQVEFDPSLKSSSTPPDYLSHASAMRHRHFSLREERFAYLDAPAPRPDAPNAHRRHRHTGRFAYLDGAWGLHTVDRIASADNRQPLGAPHAGRFFSQCFHTRAEAEWTDALALPWGRARTTTGPSPRSTCPPGGLRDHDYAHPCVRRRRPVATLICPSAPWASWWPSLRERGGGWVRDAAAVQLR